MGLEKLKINNVEFTKYADYFVLNELVYTQEPTRGMDGTMEDLKGIDTFIVPRIFIDFNYLDIVDYRNLLKATSTLEFPIEYYDFDEDNLKPISRSKLYVKPTSDGVEAKGIRNLSLEFVATLRDNVKESE